MATYGNDDFVPVILGTNLNAYNLARSLHEAYGVRSLALGRYAVRETAHSSIIDARAYADFGRPEAIVRVLDEVAHEFPDRTLLLLPTIEFYTNVVLEHRAELDERYVVPLPPKALADKLMNKTDFYRTCAELDVPHPLTSIVSPGDADDADLGTGLPFPYPVILKPSNTDIYPRLTFTGKKKVYLVQDAQQLREIAGRIFAAGYDDDLIVQEYLAGDETVLKVANSYSDRSGSAKLISVGQVVLTEFNPALLGNNNAIVSTVDDALAAAVQRFLDGVGYIGLANFDVMLDRRTGVSKLLEVNLRPGATSYYAMGGGGNLARAAVEDLVYGRELPFTIAQDERLWLNVPYPVALRYTPAALRPLLRTAAKKGTVHTLRYAPDLDAKRRLDIARIDLRHTLDHVKFAGVRPS